MKSWKKTQKKYKFVAPCSVCGLPVTNAQIAVKETDIFVTDYTERELIRLPLCLCVGCVKKIRTNNALSLKKAVERFEQTMRND